MGATIGLPRSDGTEILRIRPIAAWELWAEGQNYVRVPWRLLDAAKTILCVQGPEAVLAFVRAAEEKEG